MTSGVHPDLIAAAEREGATIIRSPGAIVVVIPIAVATDEILDGARVEEEYPFLKWRNVRDAARLRGELVIEHAGRKPVVRRSRLEKWIASRPKTTTKVVPMSPREAAKRAAAERAERRAS